MLDYPLLEAVAAVDREGSFEGAARALHVTSSAISQRVKLLEERVGTPLVVRGRPCTVTPAGRHLCRHVEQVQRACTTSRPGTRLKWRTFAVRSGRPTARHTPAMSVSRSPMGVALRP